MFSGLVIAYLFAVDPTNLSLSLLIATIDGVVLTPSEFSITFAEPPS